MQGDPALNRRTDASYWMASTDAPEHPALDHDLEVDVAVVGAGVAGISAAAELVAAGRSVALLEADRVAAGVTGHTTAKVSALHGARYHRLGSRLGLEVAAAYAQSQTLAMEHVVATAQRLQLDCDLERRPGYVFSESDSDEDLATLHEEAEAARRAGLPASFTTDTGLPFPVGGAVRVEDQLMFHPRKYLLGVLADLVGQGGLVFEGTRVTGLDEGTPCTLTCESGVRVTARDVVVTTHYPIFDRSLLFARLTPRREFAVAGVADPAQDPPGMYISLGADTRSIRSAPYDGRRLLIATGAPFTPGDSSAQQQVDELTAWLRDRFGVDEVRYTWAAQDNHTGDQVSFIGRLRPLAEHAWVATGFGGWGMTNGVLSGLLIPELIAGRTPSWAGIYDTTRVHPRLEAGTVAAAGARTVSHWAGSRLRAVLDSADTVEDIAPGQAGLVTDEEGSWATYRDEADEVHAVSSTCTHMGCLVSFNDVEREWECPCHGSRFALDGSVVQGPATSPLRRRSGIV